MKILRSDLCKVVQRQRAAVITFFFCWASLQISAEIPIIAFGGVPAHESTAERFKEFREAGFDVSIEHYWDTPPQQLRNILDIAHNESVRITGRPIQQQGVTLISCRPMASKGIPMSKAVPIMTICDRHHE